MTKLYGIPVSPYVRKLLIAMDLKGIAYELVPVSPMSLPADYEKISPLRKIPAFQDDMVSLADSTVIAEYLDERYNDKKLYPTNIADRARARWFEEFADSRLAQTCGVALFFERVVKPMFRQQACDEAVVAKNLAEEMPKVLAYLESEITGRDYLAGDALSIADIAVASMFINAAHADFTPDQAQYPNFVAYLKRIFALPAVQKWIEVDKSFLAPKAA